MQVRISNCQRGAAAATTTAAVAAILVGRKTYNRFHVCWPMNL